MKMRKRKEKTNAPYEEDADPSSFPADCPWTDVHGEYVNGEPNKPLFVSALVYLNDTWPDRWDAETLFMDSASSTGVFVRPRPGRLVLMAGRVFFCFFFVVYAE